MVYKSLKNIVIDSPLEKPVRTLMRILNLQNKSEWSIRIERDQRYTERLLAKSLRTNFNCVDVGANRGVFLKLFLQNAPKGMHIAFEPISQLSEKLKIEFPQVKVINCALSNRKRESNFFYLSEMDGWSGLQKQQYPISAKPEEIRVKLECMDDIIASDFKVDFIKIDVEGAELEVLEGAEFTIKRCKPIILFEHAKIHNENYKTTPDLIYDFLVEKCGMKIWDISLSQSFSRTEFMNIYESSYRSNYDRKAQTNFVAKH